MSESDGEMLARIGTDALLWAQEFMRINAKFAVAANGGSLDEGAMIAWFANALEAGRAQGRRETCPHDDVFTLSDDVELCRTCGMLFHYIDGALVDP